MAPSSRSDGKLAPTAKKIQKSADLIHKIRFLRAFHKDKKRESADSTYKIRVLGGFHKEKKLESADITRLAGLLEGFQSPQIGARATFAGSEEKFLTSPAQSFRRKEIGERTAAAEVVKGAAGSEEKRPTSPAGGWSLRAIMLVLTAVVAVAGPILLLVRFHGHPMSQVWILSLSICSDVFFFLQFIWRSRWFYTDFVRLSYGPMLAFCSASVMCSATVTFVLLFSMVWAAGNLGYSLAVHRLRKGTDPAIHMVPSPPYPTKNTVKELSITLYSGAPFVVLLWTLVMALFLNVATVTNELDILMILSYFGWIHVAAWLIIVALVPMKGFPLEEPMGWLAPALFPWMMFSPALCLISQILAVLCHLLLMMALVAFLWYNLAIYIHFLATATPSTTTQGNEDTLHSKNLEGKIGQVKSDPRIGETPSEAAATLGNEDTLHGEILDDEIGQVKSCPRLGTTSSEAGATLGNEDTLHSEILEDKIGQVKSDPRLGETPRDAAATLGNEDTLHSEILEDKIGQVKSDPRVGTTSSEAAATVGNEDTLHSEILEDKIGQVKSDPRLGETPSEAAANLVLSS